MSDRRNRWAGPNYLGPANKGRLLTNLRHGGRISRKPLSILGFLHVFGLWWYRLPGLNGRPLDPQSSALTN